MSLSTAAMDALRAPALQRQRDSVPSAYRLEASQLPGPEVRDVLPFIESHPLLDDLDRSLTTAYSAVELCGMLRREEVTSERLTLAFIKRASLATQLVNCCTEIMATEALCRARELDRHLRETGSVVGPLHGLPMSFKESFILEGKVSNSAYVAFCSDPPAETDGLIARAVKQLGGVVFCRTTLPQSIMQLETTNNVYGVTSFGRDRQRTPGGSSGGESALISLRGSVLGVGTDIGGSVRNPCALTGLYGFKPTTFRIPNGLSRGLHKGRETIISSAGPMCQHAEDMAFFTKALVDLQLNNEDPAIVPLPWRQEDAAQSLRSIADLTIGIVRHDGQVRPLPPVARHLSLAADALKAAGARVVEWDVSDFHGDRHWQILTQLYYPTGGLDEYQTFARGHEPATDLTGWLLTLPQVKELTHDQLDKLLLARNAFRQSYLAHWRAAEQGVGKKVDVLLCPAAPGPAPKHGTSKHWHYTSLWNLLDYPGVVFPVGECDAQLDDAGIDAFSGGGSSSGSGGSSREGGYLNDEEAQLWNDYDAADCAGLPVGLQLVARRFEDERVLRALELIEGVLKQ